MKHSLLYIHNGATTFVLKDQRLLEATCRVIELPFLVRRKWVMPFVLVKQLMQCLYHMRSVDAVVCQFAGHHTVLPLLLAKCFGKASVILSNGSDCVSFPSLGYGHFRKPLLAATTAWSFRNCSLIVPLHDSLVYTVPTYHAIDGPGQGIRFFCKDLRTPIRTLGYGFDPEFWKARGQRSSIRFITVATNAHKPYIQVIKGLDLIIQVAARFPELEFLVVGAQPGSFANKPPNVSEIPYVPNEELPALYGSATFYLQLSVSEGFGNALCEAMLCGCVPIVSNVGAMPEIVGESGFILRQRDVDALQSLIEEAMGSDLAGRAVDARRRIAENRPESLRAEGLKLCVDSVVQRRAFGGLVK